MVILCRVFLATLLVCLGMFPLQAGSSSEQTRKDTIIIQSSSGKFIPFTFLKPAVFQLVNNQLNIAITDRTGDIIQINNIPISSVKSGLLPRSSYRIVYISQTRGTCTNDSDGSNHSLLELKCPDNKSGSLLTIGLKTTVSLKGKHYRIYATLSGKIPDPIFQSTLSK
jgi:hypothetical protein